jgi:hypothetical protein
MCDGLALCGDFADCTALRALRGLHGVTRIEVVGRTIQQHLHIMPTRIHQHHCLRTRTKCLESRESRGDCTLQGASDCIPFHGCPRSGSDASGGGLLSPYRSFSFRRRGHNHPFWCHLGKKLGPRGLLPLWYPSGSIRPLPEPKQRIGPTREARSSLLEDFVTNEKPFLLLFLSRAIP